MTAPTTGQPVAYKAPACQIGEHLMCPGPGEIRLAWQTATEPPVETLRCDCTCHKG